MADMRLFPLFAEALEHLATARRLARRTLTSPTEDLVLRNLLDKIREAENELHAAAKAAGEAFWVLEVPATKRPQSIYLWHPDHPIPVALPDLLGEVSIRSPRLDEEGLDWMIRNVFSPPQSSHSVGTLKRLLREMYCEQRVQGFCYETSGYTFFLFQLAPDQSV